MLGAFLAESIGLTDGLVRISIGLDANIGETVQKILRCMDSVNQSFPSVGAARTDSSLYAMALQP